MFLECFFTVLQGGALILRRSTGDVSSSASSRLKADVFKGASRSSKRVCAGLFKRPFKGARLGAVVRATTLASSSFIYTYPIEPYIIVASMFFSIIPLEPQYTPYRTHYNSLYIALTYRMFSLVSAPDRAGAR